MDKWSTTLSTQAALPSHPGEPPASGTNPLSSGTLFSSSRLATASAERQRLLSGSACRVTASAKDGVCWAAYGSQERTAARKAHHLRLIQLEPQWLRNNNQFIYHDGAKKGKAGVPDSFSTNVLHLAWISFIDCIFQSCMSHFFFKKMYCRHMSGGCSIYKGRETQEKTLRREPRASSTSRCGQFESNAASGWSEFLSPADLYRQRAPKGDVQFLGKAVRVRPSVMQSTRHNGGPTVRQGRSTTC